MEWWFLNINRTFLNLILLMLSIFKNQDMFNLMISNLLNIEHIMISQHSVC